MEPSGSLFGPLHMTGVGLVSLGGESDEVEAEMEHEEKNIGGQKHSSLVSNCNFICMVDVFDMGCSRDI